MNLSERKPVEIVREVVKAARPKFDEKAARKELKESAARLYPAYRFECDRWECPEGKLDRYVCTFRYSRWQDFKLRLARFFRGCPVDPDGAEA